MQYHYSFIGGTQGSWRVTGVTPVTGESLPIVTRLQIFNAAAHTLQLPASWILQGFTSNVRYAERQEITELRAKQEGLNRPQATCAALIPIRKNPQWWALTQEERRAIFEEQSHHTAIGLQYLPNISRQLHHSRDLGEPFDFLTWFEYAPEHTEEFEQLLKRLRATKEWSYVNREVDIRLVKE
jgi:chlorite dismutase